jgi:hypothetical protein
MGFSLYQATIPGYLQTLGAVSALLDKAEAHCADNGLAADELIQARLAEDMLPFTYQITSVCHHSMGAIEGLRAGVFSPNMSMAADFDGLRDLLTTAQAALGALSEPEVNDFVGEPMRFEFNDFRLDFVAEEFLLSFSQPNFYFHATTAYDILRWKGLPIGKMNFMGRIRAV